MDEELEFEDNFSIQLLNRLYYNMEMDEMKKTNLFEQIEEKELS